MKVKNSLSKKILHGRLFHVLLAGLLFLPFFYFHPISKAGAYPLFTSAHYRLEPDNELFCYRIYDEDGRALGGAVDFGAPLSVWADRGLPRGFLSCGEGDRFLLTRYRDTDAYQVIPLTEELTEDLVRAMGKTARYAEPLSDFSVRRDPATGLYVLSRKHGVYDDTHVLLFHDEDTAVYRALAEDYARRYGEIFPDPEVTSIYADLEVKGRAFRLPDGFLFCYPNQLQYIDCVKPPASWSLPLTYEEFQSLSPYLRRTEASPAMADFSFWKPVFDELSIEYDIPLDPESPRYRAALASLTALWGTFPAPFQTKAQAKEALQQRMKHFDEDGDEYNLYGIAGLDATDVPPEARHVIIDVPETFRRQLFSYEKEQLQKSLGLSLDDSGRSEIYAAYQRFAPKEERLQGTWTLGQYDHVYVTAFAEALMLSDPGWETGVPFDEAVLSAVTFEDTEKRITSLDGVSLSLSYDPKVCDRLRRARDATAEALLSP